MREIRFRGRAASGYWVAGSLFLNEKGHAYIVNPDDTRIPVSPDTVGQFTGLLDKNEKEIYEDDIVEWSWKNNPNKKERQAVTFEPKGWWNPIKSLVMDDFSFKVIGNKYENPELLK